MKLNAAPIKMSSNSMYKYWHSYYWYFKLNSTVMWKFFSNHQLAYLNCFNHPHFVWTTVCNSSVGKCFLQSQDSQYSPTYGGLTIELPFHSGGHTNRRRFTALIKALPAAGNRPWMTSSTCPHTDGFIYKVRRMLVQEKKKMCFYSRTDSAVWK